MVPLSQDDVIPPISVSVSDVLYGKGHVDRVSGSPFPTVGRDSIPYHASLDQLMCSR